MLPERAVGGHRRQVDERRVETDLLAGLVGAVDGVDHLGDPAAVPARRLGPFVRRGDDDERLDLADERPLAAEPAAEDPLGDPVQVCASTRPAVGQDARQPPGGGLDPQPAVAPADLQGQVAGRAGPRRPEFAEPLVEVAEEGVRLGLAVAGQAQAAGGGSPWRRPPRRGAGGSGRRRAGRCPSACRRPTARRRCASSPGTRASAGGRSRPGRSRPGRSPRRRRGRARRPRAGRSGGSSPVASRSRSSSARRASSRASSGGTASGFSQRTCLPASSAGHRLREVVGVRRGDDHGVDARPRQRRVEVGHRLGPVPPGHAAAAPRSRSWTATSRAPRRRDRRGPLRPEEPRPDHQETHRSPVRLHDTTSCP